MSYLCCVSRIFVVFRYNVIIERHRMFQILYVSSFVQMKRFWQLVKMLFKPFHHFAQFFGRVMFFVFHYLKNTNIANK